MVTAMEASAVAIWMTWTEQGLIRVDLLQDAVKKDFFF